MPWTYQQRNGWLDLNGILVDKTGYSGFGEGKNNPAMEATVDVGPIPQGEWSIVGPPFDSPEHGPYVLRLYPKVGTVTFGRAGFLIHGDSIEHPGEASKGCIIFPRATRTKIYQSGDTILYVVSGLEAEES